MGNPWWTGEVLREKVKDLYPTLGCYFKVSGGEGISGVILAGPFESHLAGPLGILPQMREL